MSIFKRKRSVEVVSGDIANREVEGLSQGQIVRRRFIRHRGAMISRMVEVQLY